MCVIAFFPSLFTAIFFLSFWLLDIGMFIVASFSFTIPLTSAIYVFSISWFFNISLSCICDLSFFAMIIAPDVSLSSLCTIPGLSSPPIPDSVSLHNAITAFTSVPSGFPFAGCTTIPFGLFTTNISLSWYKTSSGMFCAFNSMSFISSGSIFIISFSCVLYDGFTFLLFIVTFSCSIHLFAVSLEICFCSLINMSILFPAFSFSIIIFSTFCPLFFIILFLHLVLLLWFYFSAFSLSYMTKLSSSYSFL